MKSIKVRIESDIKEQINICFISDLHVGSSACNYKQLKKDIQLAKEKDAIIFGIGDFADGIVVNDKRYKKSIIDPSFKGDNILNQTVDKLVELFTPVVDQIAMFGIGNHELSILEKGNFDIIEAVIKQLNLIRDPELPKIEYGGYSGFVNIFWKRIDQNQQCRHTIFYSHSGAGMGTNAKNKMLQRFSADIFVKGHNHSERCVVSDEGFYTNSAGTILPYTTYSVTCGTYELWNEDDSVSFPEKRGLAPYAQKGAIFGSLTFDVERGEDKKTRVVCNTEFIFN